MLVFCCFAEVTGSEYISHISLTVLLASVNSIHCICFPVVHKIVMMIKLAEMWYNYD